jgi:hypothetical protein
MLTFASSSNGLVNTTDAIVTAIQDAASGKDPGAAILVALHLTMGHDNTEVTAAVRKLCPKARIVGCTCAGVIGKEGANESMRAVAVMLAFGEPQDLSVTTAPRLDGSNSRPVAKAMAEAAIRERGKPRFWMFLGSGIDIDTDAAIAGIEDAAGTEPTIFGGTSADNMKGVASFQFLDDETHEHAAALIGFHDPSLQVWTQASHGFVPAGIELEVTKATGNRVHELDGQPAWRAYTSSLGLPETATPGDTIPPGAVGVALPPAAAAEYGDSHLLRVITRRLDDGTFLMPVCCPVGTRLSLMRRDEPRIFANLDVMMSQIRQRIAGRKTVAVFHADCGARGRLTLDRVAKEEIVRAMQEPLHEDGQCPPWIGMYGFGEFARLGGRNEFHNYTTALYVVTR